MFSIYRLKNRYGEEATLYHRNSPTPNYVTGTRGDSADSLLISKVIKAGQSVNFAALVQSLSGIAPDSMYQNNQNFLIDLSDLPAGWTVAPEDYIIVAEGRFEVLKTNVIEPADFLILITKKTQGPLGPRVIQANLVTYLNTEVTVNG